MTGGGTGALLGELSALRRRARADRHAYWFPLVIFGLIELGTAPFYVRHYPSCPTNQICSYQTARPAFGPWWPLGGGAYTLIAPLAGLALTVWWYRRHARAAGVGTGTQGSVQAWTGSAVVLLLLLALPVVFVWELSTRDTTWLIPIAIALLALAWAERSWLAGTVAGLHAVAAVLGVVYDPENLLYRVLHWFGVADSDMPYSAAGATNVVLPGTVLLLGGLVALALDVRRTR